MKTENPDEVMLNPEYLKKMMDAEKNNQSNDGMSQELKQYFDDWMSDPENQVDCSVMKYILDYLSDPMNSSMYRNEVLFKNPADAGNYDDESVKDWEISIPIFSTSF